MRKIDIVNYGSRKTRSIVKAKIKLINDYLPEVGSTIDREVKESIEIPISVEFEDECNHDGWIWEERDFGSMRHDSSGDLDWFDDIRNVRFCPRKSCEAVDYGEGWVYEQD